EDPPDRHSSPPPQPWETAPGGHFSSICPTQPITTLGPSQLFSTRSHEAPLPYGRHLRRLADLGRPPISRPRTTLPARQPRPRPGAVLRGAGHSTWATLRPVLPGAGAASSADVCPLGRGREPQPLLRRDRPTLRRDPFE